MKFKFAQPLYDMLCVMYKDVIPHISQKYIELHKNHKMPFSQKTWRQGLQTLGTEWGRNIIAKDIWIDICLQRIRVAQNELGWNCVISDMRFISEFQRAKELMPHAETYGVYRDISANNVMNHQSETEVPWIISNSDGAIQNNKTIQDFYRSIETRLQPHADCAPNKNN